MYKVYYKETELEAKQSWIYAVLLMSVGPGGGGIYSIIEDVVCKEYFQKTDLEAKQSSAILATI